MGNFQLSGNAIISVVGRFLLAVVLLLSGISKLFYLQSFASEVAQYGELYFSLVLALWSKQIAIMVCCLEILLGVSLFISKIVQITVSAALVLMTFFLYVTGVNYLFPTQLGSIESCGCFGELVHFSAKDSFIKNIILWVFSLVTFISNIKFIHRPNCKKSE